MSSSREQPRTIILFRAGKIVFAITAPTKCFYKFRRLDAARTRGSTMLERIAGALRKAAGAALKNKAAIPLLFLLAALLAAGSLGQNGQADDSARIGVVREPNAYCAFAELGSGDPKYSVSVLDGYPALLAGLNSGELDAAILPVQYFSGLDTGKCSVVAITAYLNLTAVENGGTASTLSDLDGRTVILSESIKGLPEMRMLDLMISRAGIFVQYTYLDGAALLNAARRGDFDILILPPGECAAVLLQNNHYRSCFNLASQWPLLMGTQPPAGCMVVTSNATFDKKAPGIAAFLHGVEASTEFISGKHKKAATLIAASGLGGDYAYILKTIPRLMFHYADGEEMKEPIKQWEKLME